MSNRIDNKKDGMLHEYFRLLGPIVSWRHPDHDAVLARSLPTGYSEDATCSLLADERRLVYIAHAHMSNKSNQTSCSIGRGVLEICFGLGCPEEIQKCLKNLSQMDGGHVLEGGDLGDMLASQQSQDWLAHIKNVLAASAWIASQIVKEKASVLVQCSEGWETTSQLVSLACLFLDPHYRTFKGFQELVGKNWVAFGHDLSVSSSNSCSPVFLQWTDCVWQLTQMYPSAFEFSSVFLGALLDGAGLCDDSQDNYNVQYGKSHPTQLLPPCVSFSPVMWAKFHIKGTVKTITQAEKEERAKKNKLKKQKQKERKEQKRKELKEAAVASEVEEEPKEKGTQLKEATAFVDKEEMLKKIQLGRQKLKEQKPKETRESVEPKILRSELMRMQRLGHIQLKYVDDVDSVGTSGR